MAADTFDRDAPLPIAFRGYAREAVDSLLEEVEKSQRALIGERDELRAERAKARERLAEVTAELERRGDQERAAADANSKLERLEESNRALTVERDALRADLSRATERLKGLESELERHLGRERAVADALIEVTREVAEMRRRAEQEAQELVATAEREAKEIRRAAELDAEATVRDAQIFKVQLEAETAELRARAEIEADELLRDARSRADRLVEDVRGKLEERQHQAQDLLDDTRARLDSLVRDLFEQVDRAAREPDSVEPEHTGT